VNFIPARIVFFLLPLLAFLGACCTVKRSPHELAGGTQVPRRFSFVQTRKLATDYLLFLPEGYASNSGRRWPLILFLHGGAESGSNIWKVAKNGPPHIATQMSNFPFIVISPQCPDGKTWSNELLIALLDDIEQRYLVDTHRVYLTGVSLGGFGTWSLGLSYPERFAALAPFCGGGDFITPHMAEGPREAALKTLPVWAFHGAKDPAVPVEESRRMVAIMQSLGDKDVKLTIYPDAGHVCWTQAYAGPDLYAWFLQHSR
jgi:predicted peptidase